MARRARRRQQFGENASYLSQELDKQASYMFIVPNHVGKPFAYIGSRCEFTLLLLLLLLRHIILLLLLLLPAYPQTLRALPASILPVFHIYQVGE